MSLSLKLLAEVFSLEKAAIFILGADFIVVIFFVFSSTEVATHTVEVSLNIDSRILEHKPVKRGKGRPPKNASTFDAFDIVAEQTLRVSIR